MLQTSRLFNLHLTSKPLAPLLAKATAQPYTRRFFSSTICLQSVQDPLNNNLPKTSVRTSKRSQQSEFSQQDRILLDSVEKAVNSGTYERAKVPLYIKIAMFTVPMLVFVGGYVAYNTIKGKPVFFPMWFTKTLPLDKAKGIETVDIEKLKDKTRSIVLSRLSMNRSVKEKFGLPLQLGNFDKFDVSIEYQSVNVEGLQIDCTKSWLHPRINYCQREIVKVSENLNGFLDPMTTDGNIDFQSVESTYPNAAGIRDYNIIIKGRIGVLDSESASVDQGTGDIQFTGVIEFDHTKTIKLTSVVLAYTENGNAHVEKLW